MQSDASTVKGRLTGVGKAICLVILGIQALTLQYTPVRGGIDPSWEYIINAAFQRRIPEFLCSSGLLGFINYPLDIGANLTIAIIVRLACWLLFMVGISLLVIKRGTALWNLAVFTGLFLFGSGMSFDYAACVFALFFLALAFFENRWLIPYLIVNGFIILLWFIKMSAGVLVLSSSLLCVGMMVFSNRRKALRAGLITIVGAPLGFGLSYWLYDPSLARMYAYFERAVHVSAGYNVAMSAEGKTIDLWRALMVLGLYLVLLYVLQRRRDRAFWFGLALFPALFMAFKHGFVRQDGHEATFFGFFPVLIGLIVLFASSIRFPDKLSLAFFPAIVLYGVMAATPLDLPRILGIPKIQALLRLADYADLRQTLAHESLRHLQPYRLPDDWVRTIGSAPVGTFPWEAGYIPANRLEYRVFPIIQSYIAYTAYLDQVNAVYLANAQQAPEFIIMDWGAINDRHALMDVPGMWLELYRWYDVAKYHKAAFPIVLLKRRAHARFRDFHPLEQRDHIAGDFIDIPASEHPVLIRFRMKLTLWGQLMKLFFRVPEVTLEVVGTHGTRVYRIVPETLSNPLFVNALPSGLTDVTALLNNQHRQNQVYGIMLSGKGLPLYHASVQLEFYHIPDVTWNPIPEPDLRTLEYRGEATEFDVEKLGLYTPGQASAGTQASPVTQFLMLEGWALDSEARAEAGGVWIDIDGTVHRAYAGVSRYDLVKRYQRPEYERSGFRIAIPASAIGQGRHTVSLKVLSSDRQGYYSSSGEVVIELP